MNKPKMDKCCTEMEDLVKEGDMISILDIIPFRGTPDDKITVYICSDGGHGGMLEIKHCPFCGIKINTYY